MWPMCDWTRLYCCINTAARLSRGVADGHATSVIQFQAGGDESRLRRQRYYVSEITAIVPRSTNRCKQSGDRFEPANGRCLNEFRYSFWVYTENENATSFSAVWRPGSARIRWGSLQHSLAASERGREKGGKMGKGGIEETGDRKREG